jgi:uncharacterized membrane protein
VAVNETQGPPDRPAGGDVTAALPPAPGRLTRSPIEANALVHLYRAEVGRMTTYRVRLDTTTNWALSSSLLAATFTLGNPQVTHAAFLFVMGLIFFFLQLEARRFRAYEGSRRRVQLLEAGFYSELLGEAGWPTWSAELLELLRRPTPPISRQGALGWRLRRNYVWIYLAVLAAWLAKLGSAGWPAAGLPEYVERATVGMLPGWLVMLAVLGFYAWLASLTLQAGRRDPLGDDEVSLYPRNPTAQE